MITKAEKLLVLSLLIFFLSFFLFSFSVIPLSFFLFFSSLFIPLSFDSLFFYFLSSSHLFGRLLFLFSHAIECAYRKKRGLLARSASDSQPKKNLFFSFHSLSFEGFPNEWKMEEWKKEEKWFFLSFVLSFFLSFFLSSFSSGNKKY